MRENETKPMQPKIESGSTEQAEDTPDTPEEQMAKRKFEERLSRIDRNKSYTMDELQGKDLFFIDFSVLHDYLEKRTVWTVLKTPKGFSYKLKKIIGEPLADLSQPVPPETKTVRRIITREEKLIIKGQEKKILEFLKQHQGQHFTSAQIAEALGLERNLVSLRFRTLTRLKKIWTTTIYKRNNTFVEVWVEPTSPPNPEKPKS